MKVVLADDHRIVRDGLRWMLAGEPSVDVVGQADSGGALIDLLDDITPDVILLDIRMPGMNGLDALEHLRNRIADVKVVVLSMYDDPAYVRRAVELGADGYLLKSAGRAEVLRALECVCSGHAYVQAELTGPLLTEAGLRVDSCSGGSAPCLTAREREILVLLADGFENKQIARRLGISEATVKSHLKALFSRLEVENRAEAVAVGLRRGLID